MAENYINLAWILREPENRTKMFVEYGLGRETKILEYARAKENKTEIDHQYIESTENWINEQRFYFLNNINLGSWKFGDVRNTAIDAGMKEYYDMFYDVGSFAVHSTWNYISKHNLKMCESPFHKDHRIPVINEPIIDTSMFLILAKIMQDTFELVDTHYSNRQNISSSFEYLMKVWHNDKE